MPVSNPGSVAVDPQGFSQMPGDPQSIPFKVTKTGPNTYVIWVLDGGVAKPIYTAETRT